MRRMPCGSLFQIMNQLERIEALDRCRAISVNTAMLVNHGVVAATDIRVNPIAVFLAEYLLTKTEEPWEP